MKVNGRRAELREEAQQVRGGEGTEGGAEPGSFAPLDRGHSKQVTGCREVREGRNPRVWELLYERSFRKMFRSKWSEKQWKVRKLGFPKRQCF